MYHICYLLSFFTFTLCMIPQEKGFGDQSSPNILLLKSAWLTLCLSTEVRNEPQILILFRCLQPMLVSVWSFILTGSVGRDGSLRYCITSHQDRGMGNFCLSMGQAIVCRSVKYFFTKVTFTLPNRKVLALLLSISKWVKGK